MSDLWMPYILTDFNGQNQIVSILDYEREKDRVLHINGEINDFMAQILTAQIRYLESKSEDDITLMINSPGGSVSAGLAIVDAMEN